MRQAVNYAIDRRTLAALGDGFEALPERPTDHYLPPGMAGFRDVNVYPLTPDLASARRLVNEGGRTAVLYTCDISPCPEGAQIIKTELAAIGLRVRIKTFPFPTFFARIATPGEPFDLAWAGYIADYPDPQGILDPRSAPHVRREGVSGQRPRGALSRQYTSTWRCSSTH